MLSNLKRKKEKFLNFLKQDKSMVINPVKVIKKNSGKLIKKYSSFYFFYSKKYCKFAALKTM